MRRLRLGRGRGGDGRRARGQSRHHVRRRVRDYDVRLGDDGRRRAGRGERERDGGSRRFSSLVHSLPTSSFHSVHVRVVSTLRASLARAPPFESMLPHEAYRNALRIATDLDASLCRVSDDAHELLVHAEEREKSERRLRQSLYVQTCEIMGRLLNELRRMLVVAGGGTNEKDDATKVLIVGRLCHLLKFRIKFSRRCWTRRVRPRSCSRGDWGVEGEARAKWHDHAHGIEQLFRSCG